MEPDKTQQLQNMARETFPNVTKLADELKRPLGYKGGSKKRKRIRKKEIIRKNQLNERAIKKLKIIKDLKLVNKILLDI